MKALAKKERPLLPPMISVGESYSFQIEREQGLYWSGTTSSTIDVNFELFRRILEQRRNETNKLLIPVTEIREWEIIIRKINLLEDLSGILGELTPEQVEVFEQTVKRRSFFK